MTDTDPVLRSGDDEQAAGGQASNTQAWMERYKRHMKSNDRKWRTKSMRRAAGNYLGTSKFGDEVVSKVLLLARWRNKARKHAEDRGFSMAARRPWLARFQAISERSGCVFGAGMEYDGINSHVEMMLQVSRAEEDRRLDLAAEQRAKELTTMDAIQERVRQAMRGVRLWTESGSRTVGSDDDGMGVRANSENSVRSRVADKKESSAGKAAARRASLLLRGPRAAIVPVNETPIQLPVMRPQLPFDAARVQEHLTEAVWPRQAQEGTMGTGDNAGNAPEAVRHVMAMAASELISRGPASAVLGDQSLQEIAVPSPSSQQSAPGSQLQVMEKGEGAAGGALVPSAPSLPPSSPPAPPTPQRQPVPCQQDKMWPDMKDLVADGLDSYLSAVATAATYSPAEGLAAPVSGQCPGVWQTHVSGLRARFGTGAGEKVPTAQHTAGIPSSLLVPSLSPPPVFCSQQQQEEQRVIRLQSHTPELGQDEDLVAAVKDDDKLMGTIQPSSQKMLSPSNDSQAGDPNVASAGGGVAPSPLANVGGAGFSLHDVAPSLGGMDACRVATAVHTLQGRGGGGSSGDSATASVAALIAATSPVLSKQVRGGPLPHSLTMTRRGRQPALPDPAMATTTHVAGRPRGAEALAASASLSPAKAAGSRAATGKANPKLQGHGAAAGATAGGGSGGGHAAHGVRPNPLESTSSRHPSDSPTVSFISRQLEGDMGHKHTATLSKVDAALFWNSEATPLDACSASVSGGESPLSRAGKISRLHSLRPSPLPLVHPPLIPPDLVASSMRLNTDGASGDSGRHEAESDSSDSDDAGRGVGDGRLTPISVVSSSYPAAAGLLSPAAIPGTAVNANRSTSSRSLTTWPGGPTPSAAQPLVSNLLCALNHEAPPSPWLTRASAATHPHRLHPFQPAAGSTTAAMASGVANPESPTPRSPVINSPFTARNGIFTGGPVGKPASATTAGSSVSCTPVRTNGLASPAPVQLTDADSPSPARREATKHQTASANELGNGHGPSNGPIMPALSRPIRLEAEDMSILYGLRRSVQPGRTAMSMSSLPQLLVPAAQTQPMSNSSPTRLRQPYSFAHVTVASGTDLEERSGCSFGAAIAAHDNRCTVASAGGSEFAPSRFPNEAAVALPDAAASLGRHTPQRGTMSGPQPRLFLPELRSTTTAGARAASQGMEDTAASRVRGDDDHPSPFMAATAMATAAGKARLLPGLPTPALPPAAVAVSAFRGY